ncbi:hypothetical protein ACFV0G_37835, partial [Kitasatospora sp. NPDC059571]
PPPPRGPPPPPPGAPPARAPPPPPRPPPTAQAAGVRWSGEVVLGMDGIDLTPVPPHKGGGAPVVIPGTGGMQLYGTAARWTGPGEPTAQACRDLLLTQALTVLDVAEGDTVCLVNGPSPIAALQVTSAAVDQSFLGQLRGRLTVWNLHLDH